MAELTAGRFFDLYGASMDAALHAKVADIEPWLVDGLVVDRGCGTGAFMRYLASRNRKVVGVEVSDALCKEQAGVIQASVMEPVFTDGFVANVVLSSVLHEVYSYNGYSLAPVLICLASSARELRHGGRLIVRDLWAPESGEPAHRLTMDQPTWQRFNDFLKRCPVHVEAADVDAGRRSVRLSTRWAVEFLSKKDYVQHWDLELREVYTSVPFSVYREMAMALKLKLITAQPLRNDWIVKNRWQIGVNGDLPEFTNQLVVLEKP